MTDQSLTPLSRHRINAARDALSTHWGDDVEERDTAIADLIADLGHLAESEHLDFVAVVSRALRSWRAETLDPDSLGPTIAIDIRIDDLPSPPRRRWTVHFTDVRHLVCVDIDAPDPGAAMTIARRRWLAEPGHPSFIGNGGKPFLSARADQHPLAENTPRKPDHAPKEKP